MRRLFYLILFIFSTLPGWAQELNSKVTVTYTQVQGVDPSLFTSLEQKLTSFLNGRKWTSDNFENFEKINCSFLLNITQKAKDDNIFTAYLTIQASRPVFNSTYSTPIINYQDRDVVFRFDQSQTLQFDLNNVSGSDPLSANLTAVFAYYVYYILGLEYDSFSLNGGTAYFQKAEDIVNRAPDQGKTIRGWKSTDGDRNRYWLVEEILNPKFSGFRTFWYTYHRKGLDLLSSDPQEAYKNITAGIPVLAQIYNENTAPILLQFYFDAKSMEWINLLGGAPQAQRKQYAEQLMKIDVTNADKYRNIK